MAIDSPYLDVLKFKRRVIDLHTLCFNGIQIKIGTIGNVETLYKSKSIPLLLNLKKWLKKIIIKKKKKVPPEVYKGNKISLHARRSYSLKPDMVSFFQ